MQSAPRFLFLGSKAMYFKTTIKQCLNMRLKEAPVKILCLYPWVDTKGSGSAACAFSSSAAADKAEAASAKGQISPGKTNLRQELPQCKWSRGPELWGLWSSTEHPRWLFPRSGRTVPYGRSGDRAAFAAALLTESRLKGERAELFDFFPSFLDVLERSLR